VARGASPLQMDCTAVCALCCRRRGDALLGGWASSPLPHAEDNALTDAQQVLLVALAIGQLSAQVVSLDGADCEVSING
jgi:hypothetical protein